MYGVYMILEHGMGTRPRQRRKTNRHGRFYYREWINHDR